MLAVLWIGLAVRKWDRKPRGKCKSGVGQLTISFFMLLVFPHGFEASGTGKDFMREAALVVRLRTILSVDVLVGLRGIVLRLVLDEDQGLVKV